MSPTGRADFSFILSFLSLFLSFSLMHLSPFYQPTRCVRLGVRHTEIILRSSNEDNNPCQHLLITAAKVPPVTHGKHLRYALIHPGWEMEKLVAAVLPM